MVLMGKSLILSLGFLKFNVFSLKMVEDKI